MFMKLWRSGAATGDESVFVSLNGVCDVGSAAALVFGFSAAELYCFVPCGMSSRCVLCGAWLCDGFPQNKAWYWILAYYASSAYVLVCCLPCVSSTPLHFVTL